VNAAARDVTRGAQMDARRPSAKDASILSKQKQISTMTDLERLIATSVPFLAEIRDMTAGSEVERWLNTKYGTGSKLYGELAELVKAGVRDGWAANVEIEGTRPS
jgi:hypothetical protein